MPTVTLNKSVFEKLVGKQLPIEELKERISYLGTDLESIDGNEIVVEVFPNRPDMLSEQGFARAFSAFIGVKKGLKDYKVKKSVHRVKIEKSVKEVRPYTACAIVKNLQLDDEKIKEIIQIQEKLHVTYGRNRRKAAIGIYPFEHIETPIYYKALKPEEIKFRPLEFDRELNAFEILKKHPAGREYGYLLEGKDKFPVFVDSKGNFLSMPPIINSHITGKITEKTKEIFIECSGFDFETCEILLNIIVTMFADMGGEIYSMELFYDDKKEVTPNLVAKKMKFDLNYTNKLLGLDLKEDDVKRLFEKMSFGYNNRVVFIPAYRADILHEVDLIEDLAIAYGYENFKPCIPNIATIGKEEKIEIFNRKLREILIGLGLLETSSFTIISNEVLDKIGNSKVVELDNPINKEFNVMRNSLVGSILEIFSSNQHNEFPQKIFEIGKVFDLDEKYKLGIGITYEKANFTELKQLLDALFFSLGLEYSVEATSRKGFIDGRCAAVKVNNKDIGVLGEINPEVLEKFNLGNPVSVMELDVEELMF